MAPDALFNETRLLFHALKRWAEALHPEADITIPMRGVLEALLLAGPATVPEIARSRGTSRQHIQQQVDTLLASGLVERRDNPAHRRSLVIVLTDRGRARIETMRSEELHALDRLQPGVSDEAMAEAAQVLGAWRAALQRDSTRRAQ